MFYNYKHRNKDIVIVPKSNDKNSLKTINKVEVKPNTNKTYDNIRNIVQKDSKDIDINSISKKEIKQNDNIKNNFKNIF